jgi:hypothetical protein
MKTVKTTDPVTGGLITMRYISAAEHEIERQLEKRPLHAVDLPTAMDPVRPWRNAPRQTRINRMSGVREKGYFVGQSEIQGALRGWEMKPRKEVA